MEAVVLVVLLGLFILIIASVWIVFEKAGEPGWASIIPIYNVIVMLRIASKPEWWVILFFIPLVNLIVSILVMIDFARNFGRGTGFGLGLAFLGFIFFPILAFSDAEYQPIEGEVPARRRKGRQQEDLEQEYERY